MALRSLEEMRAYVSMIRDTGIDVLSACEVERVMEEACAHVEKEVEDRYVMLPVASDSVPIRINDRMVDPHSRFEVSRIVYEQGRVLVFGGSTYHWPSECEHRVRMTVADVIDMIMSDCHYPKGREFDEGRERIVEKYEGMLRLSDEQDVLSDRQGD